MKNKYKNQIAGVEPGSIASEMGVKAGDILLSVNSKEIYDIFDYLYLIKDRFVEILIEKPDGEEWLLDIEKEDYEDIGLIFNNGLMGEPKSCKNKCMFCFIDQLPKGMRNSLYFRDDDVRLSFLSGNYVTLTNISEREFERLLFYKFSPVNISVHTTTMQQRAAMMGNPKAANLFDHLDRITANNIEMNFQIVLVKGVNDGKYLEKSIEDLSKYIPHANSLSVVPVGLTKHRDGLHTIEKFTREDARDVIGIVKKWQRSLRKTHNTRFVYAADEFYILADRGLPAYEEYQDFPQFENGVGMLAHFMHAAEGALRKPRLAKVLEDVTVVTGTAASAYIKELCKEISSGFGVTVEVRIVPNNFFGEDVTTAGLLTGRDIIDVLKREGYRKKILIPATALKRDEDIFLDDITLEVMTAELKAKVIPLPVDGAALVREILD